MVKDKLISDSKDNQKYKFRYLCAMKNFQINFITSLLLALTSLGILLMSTKDLLAWIILILAGVEAGIGIINYFRQRSK